VCRKRKKGERIAAKHILSPLLLLLLLRMGVGCGLLLLLLLRE
jgi:hypothetical protein